MSNELPEEEYETAIDAKRWRQQLSRYPDHDPTAVGLVTHRLLDDYQSHVVDVMMYGVVTGLETWHAVGRPTFENAFQAHCFFAYVTHEDPFFDHRHGPMGDQMLDAMDVGRRAWAEAAGQMHSSWGFATAFKCYDPKLDDHWPVAGEVGYRECIASAAKSFRRMFPETDSRRTARLVRTPEGVAPRSLPPAVPQLDLRGLLALAATKAMLTFEAEASVTGVTVEAIMLCCAFPALGEDWLCTIKYFYGLWQDFGSPSYLSALELESFICFGIRRQSLRFASRSAEQYAIANEYNSAIRMFAEYMAVYFRPLSPFGQLFGIYDVENTNGSVRDSELLEYLELGEQEFVCRWMPDEYLDD